MHEKNVSKQTYQIFNNAIYCNRYLMLMSRKIELKGQPQLVSTVYKVLIILRHEKKNKQNHT